MKRFIPSEFSCNAQNAKTTALIPPFGHKVQANDYLKKQEAKGLTWTGIVVGPAFDWVNRPTRLNRNRHFTFNL